MPKYIKKYHRDKITLKEIYEVDNQGHKNGLCFYFTADGKLYKIANFLNNKLHGKYTEYYPNGKIKKTINYENNKKNGICKEYYECGALKSKTCYQDDAIHGIFEKYYTNGKLEYKAQFYENTLQGQTIKYWPNGNIRSIINYNDKGQRCGICEEYDINGLIIKTENTNKIVNQIIDQIYLRKREQRRSERQIQAFIKQSDKGRRERVQRILRERANQKTL